MLPKPSVASCLTLPLRLRRQAAAKRKRLALPLLGVCALLVVPVCSSASEEMRGRELNSATEAGRPHDLRPLLSSNREFDQETSQRRRPNAEELSAVRRDVRRVSRDAYPQLPAAKRAKLR